MPLDLCDDKLRTLFNSTANAHRNVPFNLSIADITPRLWPYYAHPYAGYMFPGGGCNSKRKGGQVRFTPQQTQSLERRFAGHKYLSPEDRRHLALQLKLSDRQVMCMQHSARGKQSHYQT